MKLRDEDVGLVQPARVNLRFISSSHGPRSSIFKISPDPSREPRTDQILLLQDAPGKCPPELPPQSLQVFAVMVQGCPDISGPCGCRGRGRTMSHTV